MRTKLGWSNVVLIVSVQLVLLLVAVMALFSWILTSTERSVARQACEDNQAIAQSVANLIDVADAQSNDEVQNILSKVQVPNSGFACIVNAETANVVAVSATEINLMGASVGNAMLCPLANNANQTKDTLVNLISNKSSKHHFLGRLKTNGKENFVSASYLPGRNGILLLGQKKSESVGAATKTIIWMRRTFFVITLLLGLGCICLSVSTLNRMSAKVETENQQLELQVTNREEEIVKTRNAVIFGLAKLAESRDNDTGEHLDRIRSYVMILSEDLMHRVPEIDEDFVHTLALASSLHDIGKVGIPDSILLKPGRLTKEERDIMELHTLIGGECLEAIQDRLEDNVFMHYAKQVAYYHHERWDGQGYPHGLSSENIPLVARIVAVADVYDALTSKRPYKQPLSHLESKTIILSGSGSQFDPLVVDAFLRHEDEFEAISRPQMQLTDEEVRSEFQDLCERAQPESV